MRHTWRFFDYAVECQDCGFSPAGKNALGLAAQHFNRTGHTVYTEVSGGVTYMGDEANAARMAERAARG